MKQEVKLSRRRRPSLAAAQPVGGPENKIVAGSGKEPPSPPYREGGGGSSLPSRPQVEEKSKVDQILDSLSKTERTELLDRLALQSVAPRKSDDRDLDTWAQAVYEAFGAAVGTGVAQGIGPAIFKRQLAVSSAWQPVDDFLVTSRLKELDVAGRQSALRTLAELLVRHARKVARHTSIPLSLKLVANCAQQIAGIFDDAFPGYAAAGMARVIATRALRAA